MQKRLIEFIEEEKLIEKNDKILVAFSGGPDSVGLVRLLLEIRERYSLTLGLAHINHCLRGDESDGDEAFCKEFGELTGLEFFSLRTDVEKYSKEKGIGLEEAGREVRYEFFQKVAEEHGYSKIALAHNLDDNVETFLFRLMRGTGLNGLKGIPVKREKIIRPLLFLKKIEILIYLKEIRQGFRIDNSNYDTVYTRNKIRMDLIPYIEKEFNPKFKENISALIEDFNNLSQGDKDFTDLESFFNYSKAGQKEILYKLLKKNSLETSRNKVDEILKVLHKEGHKEVSLGKGLILKKSYNSIKIIKENIKHSKKEKIALDIPCKIGYNGYTIETSLTDKVTQEKNHFYFDYEKLEFPLIVRTKEEGDKFLPIGMESYKKLKKFFIDEKIDKELRETMPIVTAGDEIILIGNIRKSSIGKFTAESNKIILVKVEEGVFSER